jgi:hypothetical protein
VQSHIDRLLEVARQISAGQVPEYEHNECFTAGAFDLLLVRAHGEEAFSLLTELCARFPEEHEKSKNMRGYYELLTQIARQTGTTEMPVGMACVLNAYLELSGELRSWYRAGQ